MRYKGPLKSLKTLHDEAQDLLLSRGMTAENDERFSRYTFLITKKTFDLQNNAYELGKSEVLEKLELALEQIKKQLEQ